MNWLSVASISGFLAVAAGAFGAHGLRARLEPRWLEVFETGVLYHLVHSVVLLALALYGRSTRSNIHLPSTLFCAGIVLFSGSLYVMALSGAKRLGIITPIGGLCFLAGWLACALRLAQSAGDK